MRSSLVEQPLTLWVVSSLVERFSDKEEADSSILSRPTNGFGKASKDEVNDSLPAIGFAEGIAGGDPITAHLISLIMSQQGEVFFTSVGCMDGRVQLPIWEYGKNRYQAQYPDTITEAGLVGILAGSPSSEFLESIKKKVLISVEKHRSKGIVVHGHQECAASDAVGDEKHKADILKAAEAIKQMVSVLEVKPIFVVRSQSGWVALEL